MGTATNITAEDLLNDMHPEDLGALVAGLVARAAFRSGGSPELTDLVIRDVCRGEADEHVEEDPGRYAHLSAVARRALVDDLSDALVVLVWRWLERS